jgi:uncharacterized membrane protein YidH (DUF202 family)
LAVSKKSNQKVRIAALCALGLMLVTAVICLLFIFQVIGTPTATAFIPPDVDPADVPPVQRPNLSVLIMIIIFIATLFAFVLITSLREKQKTMKDNR